MVRQFAVDEEIERSEAEAVAVGGVVRLAVTRVDMYLAVSESGHICLFLVSVRNIGTSRREGERDA